MRGSQRDWRTANENLAEQIARHLSSARYAEAAELLEQLRNIREQQGAELSAQVLNVALGLCKACSQQRAAVQWHQQAGAQAGEREQDLRQQLQSMLALGCADPTSSQLSAPVRSAIESEPAVEADDTQSSNSPYLWARAQSILERWLVARFPHSDSPGEPGRDASATVSHSIVQVQAAGQSLRPEHAEVQADAEGQSIAPGPPSLVVYTLGAFSVYQDETLVSEWQSSRGKAIFKYLIVHRERPIAKEVLMELFWPGANPDAARNNLNVAIYGLRQTLRETRPSYSHILFRDDCYLLNPSLEIWIDAEEFSIRITRASVLEKRGELDAAMREWQAAEALYAGEFMEEDRYEDWLVPKRQRLQVDYLSTLERLGRWYYGRGDYAACVMRCRKMLAVDSCCEEAHRRLMRSYHQQGQPFLALRQYHLCVRALAEELDVGPTPETVAIYESIRQHRPI